ncbi:ATP/GTP-binding protein [Micromonospora sp. 4G55]|uniref:AAA family ATPase n=1 Tax=Micromonospora sp. 4G55 TaxID=2806102 RepID=UPI001A4C1B95|nr:ATP-binding protein [Micromonospora sp. 4G55]MBM0256268.1 AAA family ATPase [Micromonospora sp. 4G55]
MLLRFEVSNHRSIMQPVELSMIAVDEDRPAARKFDLLSESVLTVAGIYGPNASGKSNVLESLAWLSSAVGTSLRQWAETIPREPFKFGHGPYEPSSYVVEMMVRGVRYAYELVVDDSSVIFEALHSYPERRPRTLLRREGMDIHLRRGLGTLSGTRELLTPTTLALSAAMRFDEPEVGYFGRSLANIGILGARRRPGGRRRFFFSHSTERMFYPAADTDQLALFNDLENDRLIDREAALDLLRYADLGIDEVQVVDERGDSSVSPEGRRYLRLMHRVADQQLPFDMIEESEGTQTWFRLIGPTVHALRTGQTLLFDEIDASLHPRLSARLLELFQDPETNPRGAQLIFTTHDTSLLNHLNRDEVWLTEKGDDGATTLTALAEYGGDKVRRSLNLEKAYLQGRFGAVPEFDQHILRRALGLAVKD